MSDVDLSLEQLLSNASPRPVPAPEDAAAAREAVQAEWRAVSSKHQSRKRVVRYAVAATVLICVFAAFNSFRGPGFEAIRVASIQKSFGAIYVLGEQSQLTAANDLAAIHAGQSIVTGGDAGIALAWDHGGSVRLDKNTEVEFIDDDTVYLKSGRIYFDSMPAKLFAESRASGVASFEIETDYGVVAHIGTQFMTQVESGDLKINVREGQVEITGQYYPYTAAKGEQVTFSGRERPQVLSFSEYGAAWEWIARTSPPIDVDGKSAYEFLHWAGRELGREIRFDSQAVEQEAKDAKLRGAINTAPAEALNMRMATTGLKWRYEEGMIYVGGDE